MEQKNLQIRIFVEENELEVNYTPETQIKQIEKIINFLLNECRKRYQTKHLELKSVEDDQTKTIKDIILQKIQNTYLFVKCKPDLKTDKSTGQRKVRDSFDLTKNNGNLVLKKFKDFNVQKESVTYSIEVIDQLNQIFERQNPYFANDGPAKDQYEQQEKKGIPTPAIHLNNQQIQVESEYIPSNKDYGDAQDNDPNDIKKQKKDFKKTGGAGGSYQFVQESKQKKVVEQRGYTPDEIAEHNTIDDCWTVYQGKVYDITNYIRYHPGGQKILLGAGKDCTALFQKYHSWVNATFILQKYQVGFISFKR